MKARANQFVSLFLALTIGAFIGFGCSDTANQGPGVARGVNETTVDEPTADAKVADAGKPTKKPLRFGAVIGLKPEKKDYYNELHANPWPEVNAKLKQCGFQNYSIYEIELDGKLYLFSYFEYNGDDFKADCAEMAADPKTQQWWKETDPCQIRLPGTPEGEQWLSIEEVYHLD